ncbi:MAG: flagellar basal body-associated FliL family protein [Alphaproteobacteria bacterium]|nr:flagellar basal body-associated FliL family protein [Alphaproteobacteria bacterium]
MTDEVDSVNGEEQLEAPPKKNRMMLFIIVGAAVVLLLGGGAGAYFMFFAGAGSAEAGAEVSPVFDYDLPTMTVNLNSDKAEFLKLSVSLELSDESMVELIEPRMTRVIDAFQVYLRELRRSDIEGSAGIYRLKEELRRRVNLAIYPAEVQGILFREILVQ